MPRTAVAVVVLLVGCELFPMGGTPDLDGREFLSTAVIEGGANRPLVEGTRLRIGFADGRLSASAGCNILGGDYRIAGGVLVVTGESMTEMACQPPIDAQEAWYFTLLGSQPALTLTGDQLVLQEGDLVISLLDREVADPDLPLVGPTWTLTGLIDRDAVTTVPVGVRATLIFTAEGLVMVNTGCNTGGGAVAIGQRTVRFGEIALTERACEGDARAVERAMVQVLSADVVAYEIDARTLVLTIGDQAIQLTGTP